ncbi:hypothetical protein LTR50_004978 [Elasticomyces elasticus]|nr:hypothetical protein LTR50_004978 [Elasticomyces elasticus]
MPPAPKRRTASRQTAAQSTLSFHGKPSRVTKPSTAQQSAKQPKKDPALLEETVHRELKTDAAPDGAVEPAVVDLAIANEAAPDSTDIEDIAQVRTADTGPALSLGRGAVRRPQDGAQVADGSVEAQARSVSEAQIKKYWREKEQERKAPRVHQEGLGVAEKVLREWDVSGQFGPCIGIARLKRWKRAYTLGLGPPIEVLAVLLREEEKGEDVQRAYVDRLMSSRFVET